MSFNLDELDKIFFLRITVAGPLTIEKDAFGGVDMIDARGEEHLMEPEDREIYVALRNAYPEMAARIRALEAEVKAWREAEESLDFFWDMNRGDMDKVREATDATGGVT